MDAQTDFIIMGKMDCDTSNLGCRLNLAETRHILENIIYKSLPCRKGALRKILSIASERDLPLMFYAGEDVGCHPSKLAKVAQDFPNVRFNFAHCRPMDEMAKVIADCPNVWTDTAYMAIGDFPKLRDYDWHGRLMFGQRARDTCFDIKVKCLSREKSGMPRRMACCAMIRSGNPTLFIPERRHVS